MQWTIPCMRNYLLGRLIILMITADLCSSEKMCYDILGLRDHWSYPRRLPTVLYLQSKAKANCFLFVVRYDSVESSNSNSNKSSNHTFSQNVICEMFVCEPQMSACTRHPQVGPRSARCARWCIWKWSWQVNCSSSHEHSCTRVCSSMQILFSNWTRLDRMAVNLSKRVIWL